MVYALGLIPVIALASCSRGEPPKQPPAITTPAPSPQPVLPNPTTSPPAGTVLPIITVLPGTVLPTPQPVNTPVPVPPPPPVSAGLKLAVSQPLDGANVNTTAVTVKGTTKAGATVSINDEDVIADSQGNFTASLTLDDGLNAIDVIATDNAGNQAESLVLVNVDTSLVSTAVPNLPTAPVAVPPTNFTLKVTQPLDGANINANTVLVKGQTGAGALVNINDEVVEADSLGNFSLSVGLDSGPNAIDVIAIDDDGNESEILLIVNSAL